MYGWTDDKQITIAHLRANNKSTKSTLQFHR